MPRKHTNTPASQANSALTESSAAETNPSLYIPNVNGLTLAEAALAYAAAGWFLVPVRPGTKSPGSALGKEWPDQSSRDAEQIEQWWDENPDHGIALHVGKSGAIVFDLDVEDLNDLPAEMREGLCKGRFQSTRKGANDRGHYVFGVPVGESYGNSAGAFRTFGEVRGKNGVIIAAPTPHVDADSKGGGYLWPEPGPVPLVSEAPQLLECLRAAPEHEAPLLAPDKMKAFLDTYTRSERMPAFAGLIKTFERELKENGSRHEAMINALAMGFREAIAGAYPADDVYTTVQRVFKKSFEDKELSAREGRTRPSRDEFVRGAQWAAAQALLVDPEETLARLNRDEVALEERVEAFWTANKSLENLRQYAHARGCSPWGVFGSVLPRVLATIPPHVVLPGLVGTPAGLNLFVALVAGSGGGKGNAEGVAREYFPTENALVGEDLCESEVGSGNGILKLFARSGKGSGDQVNVRNRAMIVVDEVDSFIAEATRPSSNTSAVLRSAWSGKLLGGDRYVDESKNVTLQQYRYRLTMTMGVQPEQAEPLFEGTGGGTPQRFLWLPTQDATIPHPDDQPHEPEPLILNPWPGEKAWTVEPDNEGHLSLSDGRLFLEKPRRRGELEFLGIPETIAREVKLAAWEKNTGAREVNPLDGHADLTRLKVAVGLMRLDGRTNGITEEDWQLASVVMEVSNRTRDMVRAKAVEKQSRLNLQRGKAELERKIVVEEGIEERKDEAQIKKYVDAILRKLGLADDDDLLYNALKKSSAKTDAQRELFDIAAERLVATGQVEVCKKGKGNRIKLAEKEM
ncbi:bifunctional DNA primase/polymerase [Rhodococcus coprophilus]|uniref:bifunctional DNA primase/polymerase n=1 Tax=Rhodococcus coprophilus TaxID=38310 RepID=UPI0037B127CC